MEIDKAFLKSLTALQLVVMRKEARDFKDADWLEVIEAELKERVRQPEKQISVCKETNEAKK